MTVHLGVEWPDEPGDEGAEARVDGDSLRSWLVRGTRKFTVHPGRRSGANIEARRLLVADGRPDAADSTWGHLVAALQRQAVQNALASLRREDRQVLTLAFLQGHTNGEIASMLNVSARTVGRRLSAALARLESNVRHAGARLSTIPLAVAAYVSRRAEIASGLAALLRSPQAITGIAAAATVAVIGYAAVSSFPGSAASADAGTQTARTLRPVEPGTAPAAPSTTVAATKIEAMTLAHPTRHVTSAPVAGTAQAPTAPGCHGNPTSAAPPTPVRSHSGGSPVTHPGPGGCGPNA